MNTAQGRDIRLDIKIGDRKLLASGIVHIDRPNFEIYFDDLVICFEIKSDDGNSRYETKAAVDENKLLIYLYNHNATISEGVYTPIEIGEMEGRSLSFTYVLSSGNVQQNKRSFEFAFYLGPQL